MWVRLLNNQNIIRKGVMTHYKSGDWVSVGRHIAEQWIAGGCAVAIDQETLDQGVESTSGIAVRGTLPADWRGKIEQATSLQFAFFERDWMPELPFTETLIWTPTVEPRFDLLLTGFKLLKTWQVVVPLQDYTTLAANIGTAEDRERTESVIRDLRVPLRDTRLIYAKRCGTTRTLMRLWGDEMQHGGDERLAFLRALYAVKPLVCDVPASWVGVQA